MDAIKTIRARIEILELEIAAAEGHLCDEEHAELALLLDQLEALTLEETHE